MERHILDKPRQRKDALRFRQYLNLQRAQHPDRATLMLQRRARKGTDTSHLREFLRIERGHTA